MEEMERITEETANALADAFAEFSKSEEDFAKAFDARIEVYMDNCQQSAAMKFVEYMHKYACGTFLTRWYWLRKARKCNEALKGIIQFNEKYFKQ